MSIPRHRRAKTVPVTVDASENGHSPTVTITAAAVPEQDHEPTQVIEGVTPSLALDFANGLASADLREFAEALAAEPYAREPVPDLYSADPADRTEWFTIAGGSEPLFEALVADLDAMWLIDTSLPVPARQAPEAAQADSREVPHGERVSTSIPDSGSGSAPPVDAAAETTPAPADPEPVSSEDEPVQDEPVAEPDCAEGSEA